MKQKGDKKTGGRQKGTPNKLKKTVRDILLQASTEYYNSEKFLEDIEELKPKERIDAMEKFTSYIVPKLQNTSIDMVVETKETIEDRLQKLINKK